MTQSPVQPQTGQPVFVKAPSNGLATAALVLGIVGTVVAFIPLLGGIGAFVGGGGIALAIAGLVVAGKRGVGKGRAIAGLILGAASIIIFIAVTAVTVAAVDSAVNELDKETKAQNGSEPPVESSRPGAAESDNTTKTKNGPLVWGNWETVGPITPKQDGLDDFELNFRVKNTSDAADSGWFTVTVLKGQAIMTSFDCTTSEIGPGQIGLAKCLSTDEYHPGWTEITIENSL